MDIYRHKASPTPILHEDARVSEIYLLKLSLRDVRSVTTLFAILRMMRYLTQKTFYFNCHLAKCFRAFANPFWYLSNHPEKRLPGLTQCCADNSLVSERTPFWAPNLTPSYVVWSIGLIRLPQTFIVSVSTLWAVHARICAQRCCSTYLGMRRLWQVARPFKDPRHQCATTNHSVSRFTTTEREIYVIYLHLTDFSVSRRVISE